MISAKQIEQLRFLLTKNPNAYVSEVTDEMLKVLNTLSAALKVVEAAKKMDAQFGGAWLQDLNGHKFQVRDHTGMKEALASFSPREGNVEEKEKQ